MQLQWKALPHRQWIADASRVVGGGYTIVGNHREDCGHFVPEFHIQYLGRMGRYLPQVGATLEQAMALAQADHDALTA